MGTGGKKLGTQSKVTSQISHPRGLGWRGLKAHSGVTGNVLNLNLGGICTGVQMIKIP